VSPEVAVPAWEDRSSWLSLLEELFDPRTVERLDRIGVSGGWDVLEVGAGKGSIASWLARRIAPGGRAVATDVDTRELAWLTEPNLEILDYDVLADDFPAASFDLVHCRALLVHVTDPELALLRMVQWLKPGGVLLAEEPWHDIGLLSPYPVAALAARVLSGAMDGGFARRLPEALRRAGLERVEAEGRLDFFKGGTRPAHLYRLVVEGACEPLVASGELERHELDRMSARLLDPEWSDFGAARVAAWGCKPT
jgi:SAM-dependent methyltransferase